jgi:hypothetical protein
MDAAAPISIEATGTATERRIARLTPTIGVVAALVAALVFHRRDWGAGLVVGAALAWFNFRWLRQGMDTLAAAATAQSGAATTRVPIGTYFRALFRYALIGLCLYVIFKLSAIPLVSMVFGLFALGAAAVAASVYEIWHPATSETHEQQ